MKIIEKVIGMIDDELDGAEEYAECALKVKAEYPSLAKRFHELSQTEMQHFKILHGEVEKLIQEYREKNGEPPASMLAVYNYEHEKAIKKSAEIKAMIQEFE